MNPEKQMIRGLVDQSWIDELKTRAEQKNFDEWNDIIQEADYLKNFEKYFGNLDYFKGKNFLDVGAGFGGSLHKLVKKLGANLHNIDISPEAIEFLKQQGETGHVSSVHALPIENNSLDGVISTNLLNTSVAMDKEDFENILKEIFRVLKDQGTFIQSHYGDTQMPLSSEEQLKIISEIGFKNLEIMENKRSSEIMHNSGYSGDLAFIAKK